MSQDDDLDANKRAYRYSPDCPTGRIFTGADAIAAAEKDGWVDSPAKLKPKTAKAKSAGGGTKAKGANTNK